MMTARSFRIFDQSQMKLKQANYSLFIAVVTVTLLETLLSNFVGRTQLKMHVSRSVCHVVCVYVCALLLQALGGYVIWKRGWEIIGLAQMK